MYECDVCKMKTTTKKDLKKHMKKEHGSLYKMNIEHSFNTTHKCSVCFLKFIDRRSLSQHEKIKHNIMITNTLRRTRVKKCVIFEPINLEDYPLLKHLLPERFIYKINQMKYLGHDEFRVIFEIADCSEDTFMHWLFELQTKSKVVYRVKSFTRSPNMNVIFNKVYRCVHNTFPSKYAMTPHPKHTGCPATLTVRILKCSEALSMENAMADNVVIVPSKAIVTLHHCHNHVLCDASNVYVRPNGIQHNTHLNDHKVNNNINKSSSNTSSSLQKLDKTQNTEKSDDVIIPYEPENSEFDMNDNIQNLPTENDNNNKLSEDFDNYILVEYENTTNSLQISNNNDDDNELEQLLSDYDTVNEKLLQQFESNPKYFKSAIKTYILAMKNSLTSKESLLTALKSFGKVKGKL